jgi:hypothetical protein
VTAVARRGSRTATLALAAAVASGAVVALQQRVNGELKTELGDALLTALVSFGTGLVAVVAVVLSRASSPAAVGKVREVPWVQRLGGPRRRLARRRRRRCRARDRRRAADRRPRRRADQRWPRRRPARARAGGRARA